MMTQSEVMKHVDEVEEAINRLHAEADEIATRPIYRSDIEKLDEVDKITSAPIEPVMLEMERHAVAQRCIDFSRKQAGVETPMNIYDAYVVKSLVNLLTWHYDNCKHAGTELADLAFENIRKASEIGGGK